MSSPALTNVDRHLSPPPQCIQKYVGHSEGHCFSVCTKFWHFADPEDPSCQQKKVEKEAIPQKGFVHQVFKFGARKKEQSPKVNSSDVPKTESWLSWGRNKVKELTDAASERGQKRRNHSMRDHKDLNKDTEEVQKRLRSVSIAPGSSKSRKHAAERDKEYGRAPTKKQKTT